VASSINASTTAGVVTTADTSGVLNIQTAGTTAIAISASQAVTMAGTLAVTGSISSTSNIQAGTGALVTWGGAYGAGIPTIEGAAAGFLNFYPTGSTNGQIVRISSAGLAATGAMSVGGTTPTTSGAGITFPATQSASSDANTLDDYEEGTAAITLTAATGSISLLGGYDTLRYTKVGRLVTISGRLYVNSVSSPSGALTLTGLPFTSSSAAAAETSFSIHAFGLTSSATTAVQAFIGTSATIITISNYRAGADDTLGSYVQANTQFRINGTYSV
jgi:hypothetical protein